MYFFDSYAAIELIKGSPSYLKYINFPIRITFLNLLEIAYMTLLDHGEEKAREVFLKFKEFVVEIPDETAIEAIKFRVKNKNKSFSYADCLGYMFAKTSGLIFLTGDDGFKNISNVEFVK